MADEHTLSRALTRNFLGHAPNWYKLTIVGFLIANPILFQINPTVAGWALVLEFIFTLAMALKGYPLQAGGLLALEAVVIGMTTADHVFEEAEANFEVILLMIFVVAGVFFLQQMLLFAFTKIFVKVRSKVLLSVMFSATAAFLSAFLDALTVTAASSRLPRASTASITASPRASNSASRTTIRRATTASSSCTGSTSCASAPSCVASSCTRPLARRSAAS